MVALNDSWNVLSQANQTTAEFPEDPTNRNEFTGGCAWGPDTNNPNSGLQITNPDNTTPPPNNPEYYYRANNTVANPSISPRPNGEPRVSPASSCAAKHTGTDTYSP